jgi:hypothetical protein
VVEKKLEELKNGIQIDKFDYNEKIKIIEHLRKEIFESDIFKNHLNQINQLSKELEPEIRENFLSFNNK